MNQTEIATIVILIICSLVEITPVPFSPLRWLGRRLNRDTNEKVDKVSKDLQEHIADDMRTYIIDFQNQCLQKRQHTQEEWTRANNMCDKYEKFVEDNHLKNSEADGAIKYIRKVYRHCLEDGEFLLKEA
ncbi:MAG: hypothetical protein PHP50_11005 [Lachnospiraceae bacterium]|nr:hypothetical protein [Lachnospiraceae bacterium]